MPTLQNEGLPCLLHLDWRFLTSVFSPQQHSYMFGELVCYQS